MTLPLHLLVIKSTYTRPSCTLNTSARVPAQKELQPACHTHITIASSQYSRYHHGTVTVQQIHHDHVHQ